MGEFEEVVEVVGSMKEVCYIFFSCVLPYHEAIVSVSDVGYYFVFVGRVCDQVFQYLVETYVADFWSVLLPWMPQWFGGIICR